MQQQLINPQSQSHSSNHPRLSKIKPLILNTTKSSYLREPRISTEIKRSNNNLKTIQSVSYFKKDIKILQKQNFPSELDILWTPPEVFPTRYFLSKIRNLASSAPPQLTLKSSIAQPGLKTAFKNLSSLKNLTHLNFEFPYDVKEDPEALKTLFLTFGRLKKLRHLSIKINFQKDGKLISSCIAHLSQLRSLELIIEGSNLFQFTSLLPNFPHLTRFYLYFNGTGRIRSEDFLAFYMGFQNKKSLTDLTLDLGRCSLDKGNPTDIEPLAEGLNALNPSIMQKLRLRLCYSIPIDGLIKIFEAFKKFTRLETFELLIPYFEANKIAGSLSPALSELGSLKSLKIHLNAEDDNRYAMNDIAPALKSLQNLAFLKLYFKGEAPTKDEQIQKLSSSLKKLQSLQYLDLQFQWQKSISDSAFESLSESFKELTNLKNLSLSFEYTQGLTDKGVSAFRQAMKGLKNLTGLTLELPKGDSDEKTIGEVAQMVREMPQLSDVEFRFDKCPQLKKKEDTMASLFQALKESENIKKIVLRIDMSAFNRIAMGHLKLVKGEEMVSWR